VGQGDIVTAYLAAHTSAVRVGGEGTVKP